MRKLPNPSELVSPGLSLDYLAGLVDGEGNIGTRFGKMGYVIRMCITNTNKPILEKISGQYGGYISQNKSTGRNHKSAYTWRLTGSNAIELAVELLPYLHIKREQAKVMLFLKQMRNVVPRGYRFSPNTRKPFYEWCKRKLTHLNRRGACGDG